jgi:hypothetical protein
VDEADWLTCTDPDAMLEIFRRRATDRKVRLFACACCRQVWHLLSSPASQRAVALAEEAADSPIGPARLDEENRLAWGAIPESGPIPQLAAARAAATALSPHLNRGPFPLSYLLSEVRRALAPAGRDADARLPPRGRKARRRAERQRWCELLRDFAGNLGQPVAFDFVWRSPLVVQMAQTMYNERAFECMPILADALEEAGCAYTDILDHCRAGGVHCRGCWLVDLLTGRE